MLRIGDSDVTYSRSGNGAPLLLLVTDVGLRDRLRATLANSFRVYTVGLADALQGIPSHVLLRAMIDGLGLEQPHLVAAHRHGLAALHFAISDPERVGRVALLWAETAAGTSGVATLEERLVFASCPLLLMRLGACGDATADETDQFGLIARFLDRPCFSAAGSDCR